MKYPITFTTDYSKHGEYLDNYHRKLQLMCQKYKGAEISLDELPALVKETGESVIFNGETVEVYNDYRE